MKILLADDSHIIRERLNKMISAIPDATVIGEAHNGEEALEMLLYYKPDIAVLDIRMPIRSGFDVIEAAKQVLPDTKFLVLTNYYDPSSVTRARNAGADFVFDKSTEFEIMLQTIDLYVQNE